MEIEKLVQTVSDVTCKHVHPPGERAREDLHHRPGERHAWRWTADQFYAAFLAALDANGLAVYQHGRFLKIVDKRAAKQNPIPTIIDGDAPYTVNEQMITKLFRIKNVEVEPLRGVLQQLVSKDGDTIPFPPDIIIVNDVGSNVHRLERIIDQLDSRAASDEMRIIQVQYATAQDVADTVQKLFEEKGGSRPGGRAGAPAMVPPPGGRAAPPWPPLADNGTGGPVTLSQIIPDERTNKLIVVASPAAFERIQSWCASWTSPSPATGASTSTPWRTPTPRRSPARCRRSRRAAPAGRARPRRSPPGAPPGWHRRPLRRAVRRRGEDLRGQGHQLAGHHRQPERLPQPRARHRELDKPRRQVFVEAVIMEVNLDRNNEFGLNLHSGYTLSTPLGDGAGIVGTKYTSSGAPALLLAGQPGQLRRLPRRPAGPRHPRAEGPGHRHPRLRRGAARAPAELGRQRALHPAHPHQRQRGGGDHRGPERALPGGLHALLAGHRHSAPPPAAPAAPPPSLLGALGGLGSLYAPIHRQNVELKLKIKPQINESDYIRLTVDEQTEEIASTDPALGPTTSKRSAKTTVVAKDQETVVIGGIMQERTLESVPKVPILGDIPLIGQLFRETNTQQDEDEPAALPHALHHPRPADFRRIFERKMKERQQFVEQFYGQVAGYEVPMDFSRKTGPLGRMRQVRADRGEASWRTAAPACRASASSAPRARAAPGRPAPRPAPRAPRRPGAGTVSPAERRFLTPVPSEEPVPVQPPPAPSRGRSGSASSRTPGKRDRP